MTSPALQMTLVTGILLASLLLSAHAFSAYADTYVPTQPTKEILIDKMVGRPVTTSNGTTDYEFVDNLTSNDYAFKSAQVIFFRLRVKNTSQAKLTSVTVKDFKPSYTNLIDDPGIVTNGILVINAGDFEPGEEKVYIIRGRVDNNPDNIPFGTTCVSNTARAEEASVSDEDTAQFCIRKPAGEVKGAEVPAPGKIPATGAQDTFLVVIGALGFAFAGLKLRKIAS